MKLNATKLIGQAKYQIGEQVTVHLLVPEKRGYFQPYTVYIPKPVNGTIRDIRVKSKSKLGIRIIQYLVEFPQKNWVTRENTRSHWIAEPHLDKREVRKLAWWRKLINKAKTWVQL